MGWESMGAGQHEESVSVLAEVASTLGEYSFQHNEVDVWLSSSECRCFQALLEDENERFFFFFLQHYQSLQELTSLAGIAGIT